VEKRRICVENAGRRVENHTDPVEEWRFGGGSPVEDAVEKPRGAVDAL
jgi:hypothetical protein